ncbi:protein LIAT1 [Hoplias malabaricus]|uniref:protein LIAT1 n=1 Tax=Hoplias malabaricus TaxID=27720 RepID=UPI003462CF06
MSALGARSKVGESVENSSTRKAQHIPKDGKKKNRDKAKEKNKATSEVKKREHPSTPSNSDDTEKPRTEEWTHAEKSSDQNQIKGNAKGKSSRKNRRCKTKPSVTEEDPLPTKEDQTEVSIQTQESLRWEGVLNDPAAEAERQEVYRANRRKRYMAFKQILLENVQKSLGPVPDVSKPGRVKKAGARA